MPPELGPYLQFVSKMRRPAIFNVNVGDYENTVLVMELGNVQAHLIQHLRAPAFHEPQIVGMVDHSAGVRVLVVDIDFYAVGDRIYPNLFRRGNASLTPMCLLGAFVA